jgi:hypothetical protein
MTIDEMFSGVCDEVNSARVDLGSVKLKTWGNKPTYHERLKQSYYILKELWSTN